MSDMIGGLEKKVVGGEVYYQLPFTLEAKSSSVSQAQWQEAINRFQELAKQLGLKLK